MTFLGFDVATEARLLGYVRFIVNVEGRCNHDASTHGFILQRRCGKNIMAYAGRLALMPAPVPLSSNEINQIINA